MDDLNDSVMADLHNKMSRSAVTVKSGRSLTYDGIVLACQEDSIYIMTNSKARKNKIRVKFPLTNRSVEVKDNDIDMGSSDNGLIGIRCAHRNFRDLLAIDICEEDLQEQQIVYTYNDHSCGDKVLTRGSVILLENGSFDHNCSAHPFTNDGAAVLNKSGQLVGFCYASNGYVSSYDMRAVASKIEHNRGRVFTSIGAAFQNLLPQTGF